MGSEMCIRDSSNISQFTAVSREKHIDGSVFVLSCARPAPLYTHQGIGLASHSAEMAEKQKISRCIQFIIAAVHNIMANCAVYDRTPTAASTTKGKGALRQTPNSPAAINCTSRKRQREILLNTRQQPHIGKATPCVSTMPKQNKRKRLHGKPTHTQYQTCLRIPSPRAHQSNKQFNPR